MIIRKRTKKIRLGGIYIGGDSPISIQSMCNTKTEDIESTIKQIKELYSSGCDIVRVAANTESAANAISSFKKELPSVPIVADIHFDYRLAILSIRAGADGIRINPGNIGSEKKVREIVKAAKDCGVVIRVGVNSGSLPNEARQKYGSNLVEGIVNTAGEYLDMITSTGFENLKVSLKSSNVMESIEAYERFSEKYDFPLHLGITEAGTLISGTVKSVLGIGILLYKGIGDTIRVSLSADPVYEVNVAKKMLSSLGLRKKGIDIISCPTCARTNGDIIKIAEEFEKRAGDLDKEITVAIMGCEVNGPGEARHADLGIAFGKYHALLFKKGEIVKKLSKDDVLDMLLSELKNFD